MHRTIKKKKKNAKEGNSLTFDPWAEVSSLDN